MHILVERESDSPIVDNLKYGLATRCLHYGRAMRAGLSGG